MKKVVILLGLIVFSNTAQALSLDCREPVKKIFSYIYSVQKNVDVNSVKVGIGELTKYEWSITVSAAGDSDEYIAIIDNDKNCNIITYIEAEGELPKFDFHWKK